MAELGSIQVTDVNRGVSPVSRNAELNALNQGLSLANKIIVERGKGELRGDLQETVDEVVASAVLDEQTPPSDGFGPPVGEGTTAEFVQTMKGHQALANQSSRSSLRVRAQLLMQKSLAQAITARPWMRDELTQEASKFMSSSSQLTELGLVDAAITARRAGGDIKASENWIKDLKTLAYGHGEGQLGISMKVEFGTLAFSREFSYWNQINTAKKQLQMLEAFEASKDIKDARQAAVLIDEQINGEGGSVAQLYKETGREIKAINDIMIDPTVNEADKAKALFDWQNGGMQAVIIRYENAKHEVRAEHVKRLGGALADESLSGALRNQINDLISDFSSVQEQLRAGNTNIGEYLKSASLIRFNRGIQNTPTLSRLVDLGNGFPDNIFPLLATADKSGEFMVWANDLVAAGVIEELENFFTTLITAEAVIETATDGVTGFEALRREARRSKNPGGRTATNFPREVSVDAVATVEAVRNLLGLAQRQQESGAKELSAETNRLMLGGVSVAFAGLEFSEPLGEADIILFREMMTDPRFVDAILGSDRSHKGMQTYQVGFTEVYLKKIDPPREWAKEIDTTYSQPVTGGLPASSFFDIETGDVADSGLLQITVNADRVKEVMVPSALHGVGFERQARVDSDIKLLEQIAKDMTKQSKEYMTVIALEWALRDPSQKKLNYLEGLVNGYKGSRSISEILQLDLQALQEEKE